MRLSQAMREGIKGNHKISGFFNDGEGGMCALGAAWNGVGGKFVKSDMWGFIIENDSDLYQAFPVLVEIRQCPVCNATALVRAIVPHLNNSVFGGHNMSIEYIADWIEKTLEKPVEMVERENGHPPAVPSEEVMEFVGNPTVDAYVRFNVESVK